MKIVLLFAIKYKHLVLGSLYVLITYSKRLLFENLGGWGVKNIAPCSFLFCTTDSGLAMRTSIPSIT